MRTANQQKYLEWRVQTGLLDMLDPLLDGGAANLKVTVCGPKNSDI